MPTQHGPWGDDQSQLAELAAGQQPSEGGQHGAIGPRQPGGLDLLLEHSDLMAQDHDLRVLGTVGPREQGKPAEHPKYSEVGDS